MATDSMMLRDILGGRTDALDGVAAMVKAEICLMAEWPYLNSSFAWTPRHTEFFVIANGKLKTQGMPVPVATSPIGMAHQSIQVVRDLRARHDGPVQLIWRDEPEFDPKTHDLYLRLCFEPL